MLTNERQCDSLTKLSRTTTTKQRFVLRTFFERAKTNQKKLKKLLTKLKTHDTINELLMQIADKQPAWNAKHFGVNEH